MTAVHRSEGASIRHALHPLLFGLAPVLYLFSQNIGELRLNALARPLILVTFLLLLILVPLSRLKYYERHVILLSLLIMFLFSYTFTKDAVSRLLSGPLRFLLDSAVAGPIPIAIERYDGFITLGVFAFILILVSYTAYLRGVSPTTHDFLNVMAAVIISISIGQIALHFFRTTDDAGSVISPLEMPDGGPGPRDRLPDIFFIVPDRYGSNHVLETYFDFKNEEFTSELSKRGFYVAKDARANYLKTGHSLASSLNMQYINRLFHVYGSSTGNWHPVFDLIRDNEVQRLLRSRGYRYVHLGSRWPPTASNPHADINFTGKREVLSPLEQLLYDATPAHALTYRLRAWRGQSIHAPECDRVARKLAYLKGLGGGPQPVFVFAHFLVPHEPIKFDARGNCIAGPSPRGAWAPFKQAYVEQVKFINSALLDVFDNVRANNPHDLVFIIQSDEGPFPRDYHLWGKELDWETMDHDNIVMKFGIISAFYFSDESYTNFYSSLSPVNTFRLVLNRYFDAGLPLLQDRSYIHKDGSHIFKFTDVTAVFSSLTSAGVDALTSDPVLDSSK